MKILWTQSSNVTSYNLTIQSLKYYPLNITFLNKETTITVFQIMLTILHGNSIIKSSDFNEWVIVHKLEYIRQFAPFSIFWKHNTANIYINILQIIPLNSSRNDIISVLSIYYQIMELPLETVPDRRTKMSISKFKNGVSTFPYIF